MDDGQVDQIGLCRDTVAVIPHLYPHQRGMGFSRRAMYLPKRVMPWALVKASMAASEGKFDSCGRSALFGEFRFVLMTLLNATSPRLTTKGEPEAILCCFLICP